MKHVPFKIAKADSGLFLIIWNPGSTVSREMIRAGNQVTTGPYETWNGAAARAYDYAHSGGFVAIDISLPAVTRQALLMLIAIRDGATPTSAELSNLAELLNRSLPPVTPND